VERRNEGASLFPFCSGDRLDGRWLDARQNDEGVFGRTADRMAGGTDEPRKYWLSSLPPHRTSFRGLVRKAKGRFRVDQDYEEMKGEVGLDHFEGARGRVVSSCHAGDLGLCLSDAGKNGP